MRYVCGLLFLVCAAVWAQSSGRVAGSVIDASGASVPQADVALFLAGGQRALLTTKTAVDGQSNFIGVRIADYDLVVTAPGFVKTTLKNIHVDPARETSVPTIRLETATTVFTVASTTDESVTSPVSDIA